MKDQACADHYSSYVDTVALDGEPFRNGAAGADTLRPRLRGLREWAARDWQESWCCHLLFADTLTQKAQVVTRLQTEPRELNL